MFKVILLLLLGLSIAGWDQVKPPIKDSASRRVTAPDTLVYITKAGKKYHKDHCRHLLKSRLRVSLTDAIDSGFEACKHCHRDTVREQ